MNSIDLITMNFIQSFRNPVLTSLMKIISFIGSIYFFVILILIFLAIKKRMSGKLTLALLIQSLIVLTLKILIHRTRPNGLPYSFPSGHAGRWFNLTLISKKWLKISSIVLGILVSFSRVYLKAHYLSDVIAGSLIGLIASYLTEKYYDKLIEFLERNRYMNWVSKFK